MNTLAGSRAGGSLLCEKQYCDSKSAKANAGLACTVLGIEEETSGSLGIIAPEPRWARPAANDAGGAPRLIRAEDDESAVPPPRTDKMLKAATSMFRNTGG